MTTHDELVSQASKESVYGFTRRHRAEESADRFVDPSVDTAPAAFDVIRGVGQLTVTGAEPGDRLTLIDTDGRCCVTLRADQHGQANFAYVPGRWGEFETGNGIMLAAIDGHELFDGTYTVRNESTSPVQESDPVAPILVVDLPDPALYDQPLAPGLNYVEVRDGTKIAVAVHLPPEPLYGPGPYPTVMEYSGYAPADPNFGAQTSLILPLMGFAVVGVNMRGTGASGGVYDVFSRANRADGYDVLETIATQPWVLDHRVGMVGLSYPGISQLITASTKPPSLCAIAPMSVIDDPWRQQWPGGVYNGGFTREWLHARDAQALEGQGWELALAEAGDEVCAENLKLRGQDVDFEVFARCLEFYPAEADHRRVRLQLPDISVPVFLTGAWQDEQTGSRFATMLDQFTSAPIVKATMFNGHHPDGFHPDNLLRLFEFLSFYVARRVPRLNPLVRAMGPPELEKVFYCPVVLPDDRFERFSDDEFAEALAEYEAEPPIRVIVESGSTGTVPGAFGGTHEFGWPSFPPPEASALRLFPLVGGTLASAPADDDASADVRFDPSAGAVRTFAPETGGDEFPTDSRDAFIPPIVPHRWDQFDAASEAVFTTEPFAETVLICGPGHLDLWCQPGAEDVTIGATVSLITPDGTEVRVQGGFLRLGHAVELAAESTDFWPEYTFAEADFEWMDPGSWVRRRIPMPPVTQLVRAGCRLRLSIHTPGRDCALWAFEAPADLDDSVVHQIGLGGERATSLVFPSVSVTEPEAQPDYAHLRGQVSRPAGL